jgi:GxxExxY protein
MHRTERNTETNGITQKIIGCVYRVSNTLGAGFLEKVYENALAIELDQSGLRVDQQLPIRVLYKGHVVGGFAADLLVEERVIVELKAARTLDEVHAAQCVNYLRALNLKVCLLVNFGRSRAVIKRIVRDY